jgi:hypothetical protein
VVWIGAAAVIVVIAILTELGRRFEVPKFNVSDSNKSKAPSRSAGGRMGPSAVTPQPVEIPLQQSLDALAVEYTRDRQLVVESVKFKPPADVSTNKRTVRCDYLLLYPGYWFGLRPFNLRLSIGNANEIRKALKDLHYRPAEATGPLVFDTPMERPWLTVEVLLPAEAAKIPDDLKKQTKQTDPNGATIFDFLITPLQAEALQLGVRISHRLPVEKTTHTKTVSIVDVEKSTPPQTATGSRETTTTDKREVTDELVDIQLVMLWLTIEVRTLFGLNTGTVSVLRALASPIASLVVVLVIKNLDPNAENLPLIVTGLLGIIGAAVPQVLIDKVKGATSQAAGPA